MLTVKIQTESTHGEQVVSAKSTYFDAGDGKDKPITFGVIHPDETVTEYVAEGYYYVMNDNGKTVANYRIPYQFGYKTASEK